MKKNVIFIGAGGYAKSVLDSLDTNKYEFCGFIDNFKPVGSSHLGYPVLASSLSDFREKDSYSYFVCIGNNELRVKKLLKLKQYQCHVIDIIDKTAIISPKAILGKGIFVGKLAIINAGVTIGENVIVNTKSLLEHGCQIGNHCNISPNATLNGDVIVDDYAWIGSSSVVKGQLRVGEGAIVGLGAVVIRSVEAHTTVVGVPAKVIR